MEERRKVTREEAEIYYKGLKVDFIETSSLQKINVKETFLCVAKSLFKINCPEQYKEDSEQKKKRIYCF